MIATSKTDVFSAYQQATGGVPDAATGLLSITPAQFAALKPLNFQINGQAFALSPNAQIWPRALNVDIGGNPNSIYLVVADVRASLLLNSPVTDRIDLIGLLRYSSASPVEKVWILSVDSPSTSASIRSTTPPTTKSALRPPHSQMQIAIDDDKLNCKDTVHRLFFLARPAQ